MIETAKTILFGLAWLLLCPWLLFAAFLGMGFPQAYRVGDWLGQHSGLPEWFWLFVLPIVLIGVIGLANPDRK